MQKKSLSTQKKNYACMCWGAGKPYSYHQFIYFFPYLTLAAFFEKILKYLKTFKGQKYVS